MSEPPTTPTDAEDWRALVQAAHRWASEHMDQWEQIKFQTRFGTVYLTLSLKSAWPEAFEAVDAMVPSVLSFPVSFAEEAADVDDREARWCCGYDDGLDAAPCRFPEDGAYCLGWRSGNAERERHDAE